MPFSFGNVVLVPFPFTDQSASKKRPAVVVSSRAYNETKPDVVLMAITSQLPAALSVGEMRVVDWRTAGLLKASAVKSIFATLEQRLIIRQLGTLADRDMAGLRQVLAEALG